MTTYDIYMRYYNDAIGKSVTNTTKCKWHPATEGKLITDLNPYKVEKQEETAETEKPKKDNILVAFYKNQGLSGVIQLLNDTVSAIGGMFGSIFRHFVFHELKLHITVGTDDSAQTAILYGKTCASVFPAMGLITTTCKVKDFDCRVDPNFFEPVKSAKFKVVLSTRPIFIINAVVVLAFKMLFKVVLKLLTKSSAKSDADKKAKDDVNKQENNSQGGK